MATHPESNIAIHRNNRSSCYTFVHHWVSRLQKVNYYVNLILIDAWRIWMSFRPQKWRLTLGKTLSFCSFISISYSSALSYCLVPGAFSIKMMRLLGWKLAFRIRPHGSRRMGIKVWVKFKHPQRIFFRYQVHCQLQCHWLTLLVFITVWKSLWHLNLFILLYKFRP